MYAHLHEDHVTGCFRCELSQDEVDHCHAALADSWGYGQPCGLELHHTGLHRYQRGDGFVILWGYE